MRTTTESNLRPEGTTAIGFKTEEAHPTLGGKDTGPVYWMPSYTPVNVITWGDDEGTLAGTTSPSWFTRRETVKIAQDLGLKVQEV